MNSVNLVGRLVGAPVLRVAVSGDTVCSMRVAVPRFQSGGLREPGVVMIEVTATGLRARELAEQVVQGMRVGVSGRLDLDEWTDADGERHSRYEVMADQLEVLDASPPPAAAGTGRMGA
ncbi:MAG: single-strand DNA-binding protein [Thermoleophilaceae bacterium]|nr:single-strand DNA-binding protein [Thermoleophilaceae bacterium]